ncbi:MAG: LPS assembly lipoprotein LptE [Pseudomonadota bacterium]
MLCFDTAILSRRVTAALIGAALLTGCGFTPVNGPDGTASGLRGQVEAAEPEDRNGFVFVARLEDRLGLPSAAAYTLSYDIDIDQEGVGITQAGDTTRFNLLGRVDYRIQDRVSGRDVTSGKVESFTGFSATGSIVGSISATEDATERLMVILADQLVTELQATAPDWLE